jgi:Cu+-exporting ATPase
MNQQAIKIEGMSCASCVGRVERVLAAVPGVDKVSVNLATEMARVESAQPLDFAMLAQAIDKAGYQASWSNRRPRLRLQPPPTHAGGRAVVLAALFSLPLLLPMLLELAGIHWMLDGRINGCWPRRCSSGWARASIAPAGWPRAPAAAIWTCWSRWAPAPPMA